MVSMEGVDYLVACFPVRPGVVSGSAAARKDGKFIYCYADGPDGPIPGQIREVSFETAHDMAHGYKAGFLDEWRTGKPIEDSDLPIIEDSQFGACAVWRDEGTTPLWLSAVYAEDMGGGEWMRRVEIWVSGSGNGGDWGKVGDVAGPMPAAPGYLSELWNRPNAGMGEHGALPMMAWKTDGVGYALNWKIPTLYAGGGAGWEFDYSEGYLFGGNYGHDISRRVVKHLGQLYCTTSGNTGGGEGNRSLIGGPGNWMSYPDLPYYHIGIRPYITSHGGHMLRLGDDDGPYGSNLRPSVQACVSPVHGGWRTVSSPLHMGQLDTGELVGRGHGFVWCDDIGAIGLLANHDKVWLPSGGWLLGAIGRS